MDNYFDFIIYLAFRVLLIHENKRSLTIEKLHEYRLKLCENHIKYYKNYNNKNDEEYIKKQKFYMNNFNMTQEEELNNFTEFIKNNNIFTYDKGIITLDKNMSYEELEDYNLNLESYNTPFDKIICGEFICIHDKLDLLDIIGATKIKKNVYKIIEYEKKLENIYENYDGIDKNKKIEYLSKLVDFYLALIGNMNDDSMRAYHRVINNIKEQQETYISQNLLSDKLSKYDKFYNDRIYIDYFLNSKFQKAIFSDCPLLYNKLDDNMELMWLYKDPDDEIQTKTLEDLYEEEDNEEEYDDDEIERNELEEFLYYKEINLLFYINYINKIEKYQEFSGLSDELEFTKKRLIYILDEYGDNLYKKENRDNILNTSIAYKEEDIEQFYITSTLFLIDILNEWIYDDLTLKKLLFVSTYYDITKDNRIKDLIDKYNKSDIGSIVSSVIFNHDYSSFNKLNKKLVKKKDDEK